MNTTVWIVAGMIKVYWWDRVGEWKESPERFPNTLKAVCDYAKEKGNGYGTVA